MKRFFKFFSFWLFLLGTATVIFSSCGNVLKNKSINSSTYDEGVMINGVKWATRNIAASGTFAAKPEDPGMFYQWNRKKAWAATGNVTNWVATTPDGDAWEKSNDPSPAGWRVPTLAEIQTLLDEDKVKSEWISEKNGREFTDIATGKTLFLPAAGYRHYSVGTLYKASTYGYYWGSTARVGYESSVCDLEFFSDYADYWDNLDRRYGHSVRAVAE